MTNTRSIKFISLAAVIAVTCGIAFEKVASAAELGDASQLLDRVSAAFQKRLNDTDAGMTSTAKKLGQTGLTGPGARAALSSLCGTWPNTAIACAAINSKAVAVTVMPEGFSKYEGTDLSDKRHVMDALTLKKPAISGIFKPYKMTSGFYGISYVWPVFSPKGEFLGAVDLLVKPLEFIDEVVLPELGSVASDVWILDPNGTIMYSRYHKTIGDDMLVLPTNATGSTLTDLVQKITATPSGKGSFTNPPVGRSDPTETRCVWKTIGIQGVQRRVVVFDSSGT